MHKLSVIAMYFTNNYTTYSLLYISTYRGVIRLIVQLLGTTGWRGIKLKKFLAIEILLSWIGFKKLDRTHTKFF